MSPRYWDLFLFADTPTATLGKKDMGGLEALPSGSASRLHLVSDVRLVPFPSGGWTRATMVAPDELPAPAEALSKNIFGWL